MAKDLVTRIIGTIATSKKLRETTRAINEMVQDMKAEQLDPIDTEMTEEIKGIRAYITEECNPELKSIINKLELDYDEDLASAFNDHISHHIAAFVEHDFTNRAIKDLEEPLRSEVMDNLL